MSSSFHSSQRCRALNDYTEYFTKPSTQKNSNRPSKGLHWNETKTGNHSDSVWDYMGWDWTAGQLKLSTNQGVSFLNTATGKSLKATERRKKRTILQYRYKCELKVTQLPMYKLSWCLDLSFVCFFLFFSKAGTQHRALEPGMNPDMERPCLIPSLQQDSLVWGCFSCRASLSQPCVSA